MDPCQACLNHKAELVSESSVPYGRVLSTSKSGASCMDSHCALPKPFYTATAFMPLCVMGGSLSRFKEHHLPAFRLAQLFAWKETRVVRKSGGTHWRRSSAPKSSRTKDSDAISWEWREGESRERERERKKRSLLQSPHKQRGALAAEGHQTPLMPRRRRKETLHCPNFSSYANLFSHPPKKCAECARANLSMGEEQRDREGEAGGF